MGIATAAFLILLLACLILGSRGRATGSLPLDCGHPSGWSEPWQPGVTADADEPNQFD